MQRFAFKLLLAAGLAGSASAAPLLGTGRDVAGLRIYRDNAAPRTFYYGPGKLSVATDRAGLPDFSFLQMRYTGNSAGGDRGAFRTGSVLSFRVAMEPAGAQRLAMAKAALRTEAGGDVLLKPLPIRKVTALLNYQPLVDTTPKPAGAGALEESGSGSTETGGYWTERIFTIGPDDATSQALWDSFKKGRLILSLGYSFYSDGVPPDPTVPMPKPEDKKGPFLISSDTLAVTIDPAKYPDRLRQIDINESIPAQYAALSIACYDFNNNLRPDIQVKLIEVEAKSVTGQPVKQQVLFSKSTPDLFRTSLKFPFAVSLKDGYRYRAHEITPAGVETVKAWHEVRSWTQLLDVTTPPAERPAPPPETDPQ